MPFRYAAKALFLLATLCLMVGVATAQTPQRPFGTLVQTWNQSLDRISQELVQPSLSRERGTTLTVRLAAIRAETEEVRLRSEEQIEPLRLRLEALGPPPGEGEPPEADAILQERRKIAEDIALFDTRIKQAALVLNRADDLLDQIKTRQRGEKIETLFKQFPLPFAPSTLAAAVPEFFVHLSAMANSPLDWWDNLTPNQRKREIFYIPIIAGVLALTLGLVIRLALLRWLGRDPAIEQPTYARRLVAGISEGLASGIVPALIFAAIFLRVTGSSAILSGLFADTVAAACIMLIIIVLAYGLPRAVLAPELPGWGMVELSPANARAISRRITFLASVFAAELFFAKMSGSLTFSDSFKSVLEFVVAALEAGGVLALVQGHLWLPQSPKSRKKKDGGPQIGEQSAGRASTGFFWGGLRLVISAIAIAALGASLLGYSTFGSYLSESLLGSGAIVGVLFLLRGLCRELIGVGLRSRFLQERLAVRHATRNLFKFWLRTLLDVVAFGIGLFLILVLWGVPLADMWTWTKEALQGITVGDVTISIVDIVTALAIFVGALVVVRMLQRLLAERVLPRTGLDTGLSHSLSAGFGYVGLVIAISLGITAIGLDLTNLALIFGALSVGIGFGLQGVVNNFVSGLVLLVERPVKVGDWVVVGENEGYVKRIQLRATELETFQRASIVIPNSEIVSTAVVNWTHKDRYGRVDVPVGVAYGSDVEQVKEILLACLKENPEIVAWPSPMVLFRRYGESALEFEARGFLSNIENIFVVQSDILTAIDKSLREAGIEIPLPQRHLHLRNVDQLADAIAGRRAEPAQHTAPPPPRLRKVEGGDADGET